jgi:hypothetical protein
VGKKETARMAWDIGALDGCALVRMNTNKVNVRVLESVLARLVLGMDQIERPHRGEPGIDAAHVIYRYGQQLGIESAVRSPQPPATTHGLAARADRRAPSTGRAPSSCQGPETSPALFR